MSKSLRCAGLVVTSVVWLASAPAYAATASAAPKPLPFVAGPKVLLVPTVFPTIQAAVDAARAGEHIVLRPGVYREQISIAKNLTITGSGPRATVIRAPRKLVAGDDGGNSIVEIRGGASVALSRLTVSGPGMGTCDDGALGAGVRVLGGAHLDLSHSRVVHIKDTPAAPCPRSATAILIGDFPDGVGSANIRHSRIADYQGAGVVILGFESTAKVSHNTVSGHRRISTDGIEFIGATGRVTHNIVRSNRCRQPDPDCGPDFFSTFQHAGIGAGAGVVIAHNRLVGNQIGIYLSESGATHDNVMVDNHYFGMALQDGSFVARRDRITGGGGGIALVAGFADTFATLHHVKVRRTADQRIEIFEQDGFEATYTYGH